MTQVKICGITTVAEAQFCVDAGADAIGLNFWSGSKRQVSESVAKEIAAAFGQHVSVVGVVVDLPPDEVRRLKAQIGFEWVQFHGSESPETVRDFLPTAYKAIGVQKSDTAETVIARCENYGVGEVLLDTKVRGGAPGGTGEVFDWAIAAEVAKTRPLTLAGGLTPQNVAHAIDVVRPYRVDVASGVENETGKKSEQKVRAFIAAAKASQNDA
ncbi:MAG: phosphoribosylanthranilate isomerase [Polyangiales bacterium]